ncbi:hypothetical protein HK096_006426, partial [Nowakowskiella sp. JEL0078]
MDQLLANALFVAQTVPPAVTKLFLQKQFVEAKDQCLQALEILRPFALVGPNPLTVDPGSEKSVSQITNAFKLLLLLILRIATETLPDAGGERGRKRQNKGASVIPKEWKMVLDTFNEALIPVEIVAVGILLLIKKKNLHEAKDTVEIHLSAQTDQFYRNVINGVEPDHVNYERVIELYVLHILPSL